MHLPSRGLRLSATTMRKAGLFLAPMRFIRIRTAIKLAYYLWRRLATEQLLPPAVPTALLKKRGERSCGTGRWQALFLGIFRLVILLERSMLLRAVVRVLRAMTIQLSNR